MPARTGLRSVNAPAKLVHMTSTQVLTPALRKLIADAERVGYSTEYSHPQFFTLHHGTDRRRSYPVWLNVRDGFDHASRVQGDAYTGEYSTLRSLRSDMGLS